MSYHLRRSFVCQEITRQARAHQADLERCLTCPPSLLAVSEFPVEVGRIAQMRELCRRSRSTVLWVRRTSYGLVDCEELEQVAARHRHAAATAAGREGCAEQGRFSLEDEQREFRISDLPLTTVNDRH